MSASLLLVLHASSGAVALVSGTAAATVRKGGTVHAWTGNVFTAGMLSLGSSGIWLALLKSQAGNVFGGLLTLYMVTTAWTAGRSKDGRSGAFDWVSMAFGLATASAITWYGIQVATGRLDTGVPAGMDFFLGGVLLLAVAGDARMIHRGFITGQARIARHLWRMCFALFEASGSFFLGRTRLFPEIVQRSGLLIFLTVLPLLLLLFWIVRVRRSRTWWEGIPWRRANTRNHVRPTELIAD